MPPPPFTTNETWQTQIQKWHFRGKTLTDIEHFALKRYILSSTFNLSYELRSDVLTLRDNVAERIFAYQAKIRQRKIAQLDVGFNF